VSSGDVALELHESNEHASTNSAARSPKRPASLEKMASHLRLVVHESPATHTPFLPKLPVKSPALSPKRTAGAPVSEPLP